MMVKKIHFRSVPTSKGSRRRTKPLTQLVFEPMDAALVGAALIAVMWMKWFAARV
jgi:hypothetical protein